MRHKNFANIFFKICLGVTLTLCSAAFLIFSLKFNTVKASPQNQFSLKSPYQDKYVPVGIYVRDNTLYLYGYDETKFVPSEQIQVLATKRLLR